MAGELGMMKGKGIQCACRMTTVHHAPLDTVTHAVVMELVKDPTFMAELTNDAAKNELRSKVASNAARFA